MGHRKLAFLADISAIPMGYVCLYICLCSLWLNAFTYRTGFWYECFTTEDSYYALDGVRMADCT